MDLGLEVRREWIFGNSLTCGTHPPEEGGGKGIAWNYLATVVRAVVALSAADLVSDASAGGASLGAVDDITLSDSAAAVVLEEVLRAHSGGGRKTGEGT